LSKGAIEAYELAKVLLEYPEVYPIDMNYVSSYDVHIYRFIKGVDKTETRAKLGRLPFVLVIVRNVEKYLAIGRRQKKGDNIFQSINVKEHKVNAVSGTRGIKALQIIFTNEECPSGLVSKRVKGLGYGLDTKTNLDSDDFGIVMFVAGKTDTKTTNRVQEEDNDE